MLVAFDKNPLVYEQPKIAVLATGSELVPITAPLSPGKIRDTNSYMLLAKLRSAFCEAILLGDVTDDVEAIIQKLHSVPGLPMYITTGGASAASGVSFEVLVRPLLLKMAGLKERSRPRIKVKLLGEFRKLTTAKVYMGALLYQTGGSVAEPLQHQGNGMVKSTLIANALLDIPAGSPPLTDGAELDAMLLSI